MRRKGKGNDRHFYSFLENLFQNPKTIPLVCFWEAEADKLLINNLFEYNGEQGFGISPFSFFRG